VGLTKHCRPCADMHRLDTASRVVQITDDFASRAARLDSLVISTMEAVQLKRRIAMKAARAYIYISVIIKGEEREGRSCNRSSFYGT
jgi:hypothetical protein